MPTLLPAGSLEGKHLNPFPLLVLTRLSQKKLCQTLLSFTPRMARNYAFFACAEMLMAKLLLFQKKSAFIVKGLSNSTKSPSHILQMVLVAVFWPSVFHPHKGANVPYCGESTAVAI